jgi:hypothetical protein
MFAVHLLVLKGEKILLFDCYFVEFSAFSAVLWSRIGLVRIWIQFRIRIQCFDDQNFFKLSRLQ